MTKRVDIPLSPAPGSAAAVRVGAGKGGKDPSQPTAAVEPSPVPAPFRTPKRLTVDMDPDLHRSFKRVCVDRDVQMQAVVVELIRQWLKAAE